MKRGILSLLAAGLLTITPAFAWKGASPNGKVKIEVTDGRCHLSYGKQKVMDIEVGEQVSSPKKVKGTRVKADYQMLIGKRLHCINEGIEYRAGDMVLRVYNDGLAFRFEGDDTKRDAAYVIADGTRRWMMKWSDGYEGFYPLSEKAEQGRWAYPALLQPADGTFALITEANMEQGQSASCLYCDNGDTYRVVPDQRDKQGKPYPGHTPWRVVIVGPMAQVVESTLVTDVCEPCKLDDTSWIHPGVVSWVYWAYNHGSNDYNIIKKYVDMASTLKLPYVLIDAEWDEMDKVASNEGKTVEDAVAYANSKGVKPLIWYNSSVGWINGAPGPKFRLNKPEDREKEFAWCEKIGVAGVKIDFFSGDTQLNMDYCVDLLESAARHHLLINFHGATIPRGWQRTYPNLMTTEGVYGAEWYNNVPTFTNRAAAHNATLPFTRNVIGPMDYTPCAFSDSQHPHITSHAHELALTVLYESGLQHLADRPESFLAQPQEVKQFLGQLPSVWDETRFVGGYPADYAVLARRSGDTWYVAGINGTDSEKTIALSLPFIKKPASIQAFYDASASDSKWNISTLQSLPSSVACQPRGGFLYVIK